MLRLRTAMLLLAIIIAGSSSLGSASASLRFHHPRLKNLEISPEKVVGGSATTVTGTVTLEDPAPTGGEVVMLASSDTSAATVPASVTIAAGDTSATFTILSMPVNFEKRARIRGELGDHRREDTLRVLPFEVLSFSFNPSSIKGGTALTGFQQTIGTITISGPAGPSGEVVTLTSDGFGTSLATSVTIPAGASSINFSLVASPVTTKTKQHITAAIGHSHKTTTLTVTP